MLLVIDQLPPLLTLKETADAFRVSEATIRRWTRAGQLRTVGFGRSIRYRREDIKEALTPKAAS